ncbi:hypothetical protein EHS39_36065 [Ensifer sp. MPMI2T]|nr:hypothetical protein EHS39_36065 [Ensifer sp. MPMI2T]
MKRHYPEALPLSEEDQAALDAAQAEYDELAELIESGMADDEAEGGCLTSKSGSTLLRPDRKPIARRR